MTDLPGAPPRLGPTFYGVPQRGLYPGEDQYLKANPHVGGMAAEDDQIIVSPYSTLSATEKNAVARNEAMRVLMRTGQVPAPTFDLTPEQGLRFGGYSPEMQDRRETVAARMFSGDPSAGAPSMDQVNYRNMLAKLLAGKE